MNNEKPAICYEEGLDEAFLVGTKKEIENFANQILALLEKPQKSSKYLEVDVKSSSSGAVLTQSLGQVEIHSIVLVETKNDRRILMNKILANNNEPEIDWEGYDEFCS